MRSTIIYLWSYVSKGFAIQWFYTKMQFFFWSFLSETKENQFLEDNNFSLLRNLLFFYCGAGKNLFKMSTCPSAKWTSLASCLGHSSTCPESMILSDFKCLIPFIFISLNGWELMPGGQVLRESGLSKHKIYLSWTTGLRYSWGGAHRNLWCLALMFLWCAE